MELPFSTSMQKGETVAKSEINSFGRSRLHILLSYHMHPPSFIFIESSVIRAVQRQRVENSV